ncbi:MAG: manganese efflux pump [Clostridia bacterium]
MNLVSVLLFAFCANLDNVVIGISYGIKKIKISIISNIIIASLTTVGTLIAMLIGKGFAFFVKSYLAKFLGGGLLISIGLYYLIKYLYIKYYKKEKMQFPNEKDIKYDKDFSGNIDTKEAIMLAMTLAINNLALGISIGSIGIPIIISCSIVFLFSFVTVYIGNFFGNTIASKMIGILAEPISGIIILSLGILQLLF